MSQDPTVFIVDDDEAMRDSTAALLATAGLRSEAFASADAFLAAKRGQDAAGCLLLDVRMPGMSGLALHEALRQASVRTPVVFVTGHGDVPMAVEAIKRGAFDFVEKPYRDEALLGVVRRALEHDAARRAACARIDLLTPRERQILQRVLAGRTSRAIAAELGIVRKTAEFHRAQIMRKLGAANREELFEICSGVFPQ